MHAWKIRSDRKWCQTGNITISIVIIIIICILTRTPRSSSRPLLDVMRTKTLLCQQAFRISAPNTWNSLPADIQRTCSSTVFKKSIYTFFSRLRSISCASVFSDVVLNLNLIYSLIIFPQGAYVRQFIENTDVHQMKRLHLKCETRGLTGHPCTASTAMIIN